jgi:hypothetical protein
MRRYFLSLTVLLAMAPWAAYSQSQSQAPASQAAPAQPSQASGPKSAKVWTNDDVDTLRTNDSVSVVGDKVGNNAGTKKTSASSQSTSYDKDPAWYRRQLAPLQANVEKLDAQIAKLQEFVKGGNVSEAQPYGYRLPGNPQDQLNQLEKKRQADAAKIDDLLDRARHNGIQPGALR